MSEQHKSMFKAANNEHGFIQCVIKPCYRDDFEALGFVDSVDRLKSEKPKRKRKEKEEQETLNLDGE